MIVNHRDAHEAGISMRPGKKKRNSPEVDLSQIVIIGVTLTGLCGCVTRQNQERFTEKTWVVNRPIIIPANSAFDGGGAHYMASHERMGDGSQTEGQKPVFILRPGADLSNVAISGGDGIHAWGDNLLRNVHWRDVGEDALTVKGPNVVVRGGSARHAEDKVFQQNHPGPLHVERFHFEDFSAGLSNNHKPGDGISWRAYLRDITARDGKVIIRYKGREARAWLHGVEAENVRQLAREKHGARVYVTDVRASGEVEEDE